MLRRTDRRRRRCNDQIRLHLRQLNGKLGKQLIFPFCVSIIYDEVVAFHVTKFVHALYESLGKMTMCL